MLHFSKRHARGTASVEAVIALPVFVVLFIGMFFLRDLTGARLSADQEVRRCSWEYALNDNCEQIPVGCENVLGAGHYDSLLPSNVDAVISSLGSDPQGNLSEGFSRVKNVIDNFVKNYVAEAITKRFEAEKAIERDRPTLFGGAKSVVRGKYTLACNVRPQGQDSVVKAVWNQFKP